MEEIIVGVVGILQFDVLKYRLENEYNVDIRLETLPYEHIRWIANKETVKVDKIVGTSDMKKVTDLKGNPLLLFVNAWSVGMVEDVYKRQPYPRPSCEKQDLCGVPQTSHSLMCLFHPSGKNKYVRWYGIYSWICLLYTSSHQLRYLSLVRIPPLIPLSVQDFLHADVLTLISFLV